MDVLALLAIVVLLAAVVWVVGAPLRAAARGGREPYAGAGSGDALDVAALDAAKEAKYREIRDAELDRGTGKLSQEDWETLDARLRAEAVEILRALEEEDAPAV
jgi:hypothetical protein